MGQLARTMDRSFQWRIQALKDGGAKSKKKKFEGAKLKKLKN